MSAESVAVAGWRVIFVRNTWGTAVYLKDTTSVLLNLIAAQNNSELRVAAQKYEDCGTREPSLDMVIDLALLKYGKRTWKAVYPSLNKNGGIVTLIVYENALDLAVAYAAIISAKESPRWRNIQFDASNFVMKTNFFPGEGISLGLIGDMLCDWRPIVRA